MPSKTMGLKSHYLAAEDYAMDRRQRGLHRFLVSSPVVLLIAISAVGHIRKPAHVGAAGTADYDRRVLAYRDRVVAVEGMSYGVSEGTLAQLAGEARKWTEGYHKGELTPVQPAAYEDHLRDGVRGEIVTAGLMLSSHLTFRAKNAMKAGSYDRAADACILAAETVLGLRGFESEAYLQCVHAARRSLEMAKVAWPHLSAEERLALKPRIAAVRIEPGESDSLIDREDRLFKDYLARQGQASARRQSAASTTNGREVRLKTAQRIASLYDSTVLELSGASGEASTQS